MPRMRRRREDRLPRYLLALVAAAALHLLLGPLLLGTLSRSRDAAKAAAAARANEAAPQPNDAVETTILSAAEVEALLGPVPSAASPPESPAMPPPEPPAPATEAPKPKEDATPKGQVVTIPPPPHEEVPDQANRVSEYNSKVEHEQRSALNGVPSPDMHKGTTIVISGGDDLHGNTSDPKLATKDKPAETAAAQPSPKPGAGERVQSPSKERGLPMPRQEAVKSADERPSPTVDPNGESSTVASGQDGKTGRPEIRTGGDGPEGGASGPQDYHSLLPTIGPADLARQEGSIDHFEDDVDVGDGTMLNTRAYKYAWFYSRMKEGIWEHWNAVGAYRQHDPYGHVYGVRSRLTVLRIELRPDGSLHDLYVIRDSGAAFLDDVAVQAVREAQPFPNPPGALADPDGMIRVTFSFYLDIDTGGLKLFRQ